MSGFLRAVFGTKNSRELKRFGKLVTKINDREEHFQPLSDADLAAYTDTLRERFAAGETLDDLLVDAFAVVREASVRAKGMRHFDVQLMGGVTLHEGRIAEMRTGEGKTLVATLSAYLNALSGAGVHIVTVNDYLARRDATWMGPIYEALGMSVGVIQSGQDVAEKRQAYQADITYGTNNEFGFDYLRDNMAFTLEDKFQRELNYAIVDEVDSILIDEARTPLIISGPAEESTELYKKMNQLAPKLKPQAFVEKGGVAERLMEEEAVEEGDFVVDEKNRQVELTERGHARVEEQLTRMGLLDEGDSLYSSSNLNLLHHVHAALKAHALFKKDVDYMVANGEVVIVDEHTGRAMAGRRWSEGIHQAVEAKENVRIQNESQTLASTTFQNYFRLYGKLAGMTGTADTEAFEFRQIYGLDVVVIPTHRPMVRDDMNDLVYLTIEEKFDAIVEDINDCIERGQPVLVGTASIESSERLSAELKRRKIDHSVLNAKQHEREADIIAQAGRPGVVTIATNMAGRGTDIVLGGNWEAQAGEVNGTEAEHQKNDWQGVHDAVIEAGGLHIIGTERHESRRIDNQLRGRSGRQGDPGSSRFYLSLEDNLMRIFASDKVRSFMQRIGEDGEAIEHRMVDNAIEKAQRKVEGHNFDVRKNLLEFDDVANDQRQVIYQQRRDLMGSQDISETVEAIREEVVYDIVEEYIPPQSLEEQWDIEALEQALEAEFASRQPIRRWLDQDDELHEETLKGKILEQVTDEYGTKEREWADQGIDMRLVEKQIMLQILDQRWKEHLAMMDYLRQSIHLRAYAQKNPKQEYKRESFELFQELLFNIKRDVVRLLSRVQIETPEEAREAEQHRREEAKKRMRYTHADSTALGGDESPPSPPEAERPETFVRTERKVGRNEQCPCGSGKKFKHCHGKAA
ncbi:MAG: preprotein translocase subunit SecA [Pseudomonadales bacterium]|jgi:preprotein translocase subunit SecA|nr:preprotein translocase subunit SecA [Pseudomonadales bacterium]MDP6470888.1 preprotein translocase subunit SecA [Pseudomonadales bacterium]MDP6825927.1 preprotein translocase subunit SecA [Pseudomonadales bacterium]MDP6972239.1 preprotein translocase subunit SecA [Pseudomonadales bacterium]|tara:strand:+ start:2775 stop:5522 length:2748 start_codon:yes stop_codon:yes gene_type:complete